MRLKDATWNIYDETLDDQMKKGLTSVLLEYNRSGNEPDRMGLPGVKNSLGDNYDVYIINESGVIVETTYAPELGQDNRWLLKEVLKKSDTEIERILTSKIMG